MSNEQKVREKAYELWEKAGKPAGDGKNFWVDAESTLKPKRRAAKKSNVAKD
jgi:hypothetical protein